MSGSFWKIGNVSGVSNPKVDVGDALFEALLKKANKKPIDVIKTGKNTFTIKAEILVNYAPKNNTSSRQYLSYDEALEKGWINGAYANLLWSIACDELRNRW